MNPDDILTMFLTISPYHDYCDRLDLRGIGGWRERRSHGFRPPEQGYQHRHGSTGDRLPVVLRRKPRNRTRLRKSLRRRHQF